MLRAFERFGGNITQAASWLGLKRTTLLNRLRKCGLKPDTDQVAAE
jgi:transcriptional regulator of acetoin/glycerol metabolism